MEATPWAPEPLSGGTRGHALGAPDTALAQMAADHAVCQFCECQPTFKLHESVEFTLN